MCPYHGIALPQIAQRLIWQPRRVHENSEKDTQLTRVLRGAANQPYPGIRGPYLDQGHRRSLDTGYTRLFWMGVAESAISNEALEKQKCLRLTQEHIHVHGQPLEDDVAAFTTGLRRLQLLRVKSEAIDIIPQLRQRHVLYDHI